jgi:hypothetical protein
LILAKPVYLDGTRIGDARTWVEVAELVAKVTGIGLSAKAIQQYASEGPRGFYVKLPSHIPSE